MGTAKGQKARDDARELAATTPANPYRGALTDPYTGQPTAAAFPAGAGQPAPGAGLEPGRSWVPDYSQPPAGNRTPTPAVLAGILALSLATVLGLVGLLLLAIVSLQDEYGAPDRSFYQGSDSNYLLQALLNFALGASLAIGGIAFLTGRLVGRVAITIAGWAVLVTCGFWWLQTAVNALVPLILAVASLAMLALCYQASVTRWLGVLPAAQPE